MGLKCFLSGHKFEGKPIMENNQIYPYSCVICGAAGGLGQQHPKRIPPPPGTSTMQWGKVADRLWSEKKKENGIK